MIMNVSVVSSAELHVCQTERSGLIAQRAPASKMSEIPQSDKSGHLIVAARSGKSTLGVLLLRTERVFQDSLH